LDHIQQAGALVDLEQATSTGAGLQWRHVEQILMNRMLVGIFIGQYCITTLTYFFLTWFPVYLVQDRGMSILNVGFVAVLPALCGFGGGILGGVVSDGLLRLGWGLTVARKTPIVIGMLLSTSMILCNYVGAAWIVVGIMCLAFFGKGVGSLGWAVMSDCVPKENAGLCAGLFNMAGNTAAIPTPIVIGYIVGRTNSYNGALVFVAANAAMAVVSYLVVVGEIRRVKLT
jgi:MFS transporter, ACS family, glucarate transporter